MNQRLKPPAAIWIAVMLIFSVTRLALASRADALSAVELLRALAVGVAFDAVIAMIFALPIALWAALPNDRSAKSPLHRYALRLIAFATLFIALFVGVAEWFFWDEFGVRFNFIAVDYLVYTTEVLGNIRESYPMPLILASLAICAVAVVAALDGTGRLRLAATGAVPFWKRLGRPAIAGALAVTGVLALRNDMPDCLGGSVYAQELARNGVFSFVAAFKNNTLEYDRFYITHPLEDELRHIRGLVRGPNDRFLTADAHDIRRHVQNPGPEHRWNVIQITVESLSASFMEAFGGSQNLTPNLDAASKDALFFTSFYATGNRTDRGMEALTLSVPPTPGRSIVKRPHNEDLFTVGKLFQERGYETAFVYGGFGYFDNMNYFFGHNGYKVIDRAAVPKDEITFANAWGACDEDVLRWSMKEADAAHAAGKPFFHFVMTTSNHRPYTYPEGRIDIPSHTGRAGAVKYTDYAIGKFLRDARQKPWFANTLFVIVADHCASSAGKTDLPVDKYSIPLIIYNPHLIQPRRVDTLCSQIDYAPTLFALLGWSYDSEFFGKDILSMRPEEGRALIANYQKLGLMDTQKLTILKPKRGIATYLRRGPAGLEAADNDPRMVDDAVAFYEVAGYLFAHHADAPKLAHH